MIILTFLLILIPKTRQMTISLNNIESMSLIQIQEDGQMRRISSMQTQLRGISNLNITHNMLKTGSKNTQIRVGPVITEINPIGETSTGVNVIYDFEYERDCIEHETHCSPNNARLQTVCVLGTGKYCIKKYQPDPQNTYLIFQNTKGD